MKSEEIIARYRANGSVRQTAAELGCSASTVRKVLIGSGDVVTELSASIARLYEDGKTTQEIAAELGVSMSCVNNNLPYSRTPYFSAEKTGNAKRIADWRKKKKGEEK